MRPHKRPLRSLAAITFGLVIATLIVRTEGAMALVEAKRPWDALALSPNSGPAHRMLASTALAKGNTRQARHHAIAAITAAPLDQPAVTVAALTTAPDIAQALGNQSAALGWRDPVTQLLLARGAEAEGAWDHFAQRIDAYARLQPDMRQSGSFLDRVMHVPAAREAMARRLVLAPDWRTAYFLTLDPTMPNAAADRVALLRRIVANGGQLSDSDVRENVRRLIGVNAWHAARTIWHDAGRNADLLNDLRFERVEVEADTVPFEWAVGDDIRGFATREETPAGRPALHVQHDGTGAKSLLKQTLVLAPGTYRFDVVYAAAPPREGATWQIRCGERDLLSNMEMSRITASFTVPAGCTTQRVALVAVPVPGARIVDLWLAQARITRL